MTECIDGLAHTQSSEPYSVTTHGSRLAPSSSPCARAQGGGHGDDQPAGAVEAQEGPKI